MASQNIFLIFTVFCLAYSTNGVSANKLNLTLHRDFQLQYEVMTGVGRNAIIEFTLISNVTGWVAIGINDGNKTMYGADIFMGGLNGSHLYGDDYHVPVNATPLRPVRDSSQDWVLTRGYQSQNRTVFLHVVRSLDTGDRANDTIIQNKPMYLLWSFNRNSHNVNLAHTEKGSRLINLLEGAGGGIIIPPPVTSPRTTSTTRRGSGSGTLSFSFLGLVIGVLAAFQKT